MQKTELVKLELEIVSQQESDLLDKLTYDLYSEMKELNLENIEIPKLDEVPDKAKSGIEAKIGELLVSVLPGAIPSLILLLQTWALRREGRTIKIKTQTGKKTIEVEYNPSLIKDAELKKTIRNITKALNEEK